ncbi:MAG TPA: Gfo/Idh/MocA family oxidoreductase [Ktedonobacterales bacterium]
MGTTIGWGILGTGVIARTFAAGIAGSKTGRVVAVGSRTTQEAVQFGAPRPGIHCYEGYAGVLDDPEVDIVYIALPHALHAEWAVRAAEAGKHVLCEKPLALNYAQAQAVVEVARRHGVFLMEAYMYRCHPQTAQVVELLRAQAIGELRLIEASFSFDGRARAGRLFARALGGGAILDVGGYCTSMVRLLAGAAQQQGALEPLSIQAAGHVGGRSGVDEYAAALLTFPDDICAQLWTGITVERDNALRIYGSEGTITVPEPWTPSIQVGTVRIVVRRSGADEDDVIDVVSDRTLYTLEADVVAAHLAAREAPMMPWSDTLGNMLTLDRWREAVGMSYDEDRQA